MLDLSPEHIDMVRGILATHAGNRRAVVFGSRVKGRAGRFSDIDIALEGSEPMDIMEMADLKEAFSLSDLPYMVDVVDLCKADASFRAVVASRNELIYSPPERTDEGDGRCGILDE